MIPLAGERHKAEENEEGEGQFRPPKQGKLHPKTLRMKIFNLFQDANYTRCEGDDDEESGQPSCSACTHFAATCKTFSSCADEEKPEVTTMTHKVSF